MTTDKAQPSSNEAVEAAREKLMGAIARGIADWGTRPGGWYFEPGRDWLICVADTILAAFPQIAAPTQDAVEAARRIVATSEVICGPCGGPLPNPDCGHAKNGVVGCCVPSTDQPLVDRIAAFATEREARVREACAKIAEASSLHPPYTADGAQASIAAAIRARKP